MSSNSKFRIHHSKLLIGGAIALSLVACGSNPSSRKAASSVDPSPSSAASSSATKSTTAIAPDLNQTNWLQMALEKAESAQNLSQTALSVDDWNVVLSRWQQAIAFLKQVPTNSPQRKQVTTKLKTYQQAFAAAQKRAARARLDERALDTSGIARSTMPIITSSAVIPLAPKAGTVYQAPIKRRLGGTPVIDVTFNGNQTFEMIVDTGASGTVITQAMAQMMGIQVVGKTKVNTASESGVEVPLGYVSSISVGDAIVTDVVVAIAGPSLETGLLGHDFFEDFDVTVKQTVVEFKKR